MWLPWLPVLMAGLRTRANKFLLIAYLLKVSITLATLEVEYLALQTQKQVESGFGRITR